MGNAFISSPKRPALVVVVDEKSSSSSSPLLFSNHGDDEEQQQRQQPPQTAAAVAEAAFPIVRTRSSSFGNISLSSGSCRTESFVSACDVEIIKDVVVDDDSEREEDENLHGSNHQRSAPNTSQSSNHHQQDHSYLQDCYNDYDDDEDESAATATTATTTTATCSPLILSFATSSRRPKLSLVTTPPPPPPPSALSCLPQPLQQQQQQPQQQPQQQLSLLTKLTSGLGQNNGQQQRRRQHRSFSSFCSFDQQITNHNNANTATTTTAIMDDSKGDDEDVLCFQMMMKNSRSLSYNNFIDLDNFQSEDHPTTTPFRWTLSSPPSHLLPTSLLDPSSPWTLDSTSSSPQQQQQQEEQVDDWLPTEDSDLRPNEQRVRHFWIVTTAALPWMTGTAVNPLLRAAYLSQMNRPFVTKTITTTTDTTHNTVTLVLPWLHQAEDRVALYGPEWQHATCSDQETYIRQWLATKARLPLEAHVETGGIVILWYPARYHAKLSSIFAMGDICSLLSHPQATTTTSTTYANGEIHYQQQQQQQQRKLDLVMDGSDDANAAAAPMVESTVDVVMGDVCILEEPEHVNFYRAPGKLSWRHRFRHVVGILHTNYKAYASHSYHGIVTAPIVGAVSSWMVRAYCDRVIKLSPVLQEYASEKEVVCNVHGIRQEFFMSSTPLLEDGVEQEPRQKRGVYFLGKLLWAKGLDRLLELEAVYRKMTGDYFAVDIYGSGPEEDEIQRAFCGQPMELRAQQQGKGNNNNKNVSTKSKPLPLPWYFYNHKKKIPARFLGRQDHAQLQHDYKIFVNPSVTEVLCTTTAEAIAMGKIVIIPHHPSNTFFTQFPNCFQYHNPKEFVQFLQYALMPSSVPPPLSPQLAHVLSWEAATERLLQASCIRRLDAPRLRSTEALDHRLAQFHYELGKGVKGDVLRKVLGGGPVADQVQYMNGPTTTATTTTGTNSNNNNTAAATPVAVA